MKQGNFICLEACYKWKREIHCNNSLANVNFLREGELGGGGEGGVGDGGSGKRVSKILAQQDTYKVSR